MCACDASDNGLSNAVDPKIDWIEVEPGTFVFGSPEEGTPCRGEKEEKQITVTLTHAFIMAKTEVTQAQWKALDFPNPWGFFDMLGNVAEWVDYLTDAWEPVSLDEADGHPGEDLVDPVGADSGESYDTRGYGVSMGGLPYTCMYRASAQYPQQADFQGLDTGFRPVRTL
jgi:formylglycine-generating enzyme required for sulfatase activity